MQLIKIYGIDGESTISGYEKWIECTEVFFRVFNQTGECSIHESGAYERQEISIKKVIDSTTPKIMSSMADGKIFANVVIRYLPEVTDVKRSPIIFKLGNVLISRRSLESSSVELPIESITLVFSSIDIKTIDN